MIQNLEVSNSDEKPSRQRLRWVGIFIKSMQYVSVITILMLATSLWFSPYNKTWAQNSICIPSDTGLTKIDSLCRYNENINKIQILKEMRDKGELLTAEEFAARVTSYYDTLVAALGTMFLLFTIATYFSTKQAFENKFESKEKDIDRKRDQIERDLGNKLRKELQSMLRDSRSFREELVDAIKGNIDGQFVTYEKFDDLENYIKDISETQKDLMTQMAEFQERYSATVSLVDEPKV